MYEDRYYDTKEPLKIVDAHGNCGLHLAAMRGKIDDIKVMLQECKGQDVDVLNNDKETPLTLALKARGYQGKVYASQNCFNRQQLQVGKCLQSDNFLSASTLYSVALSHVPDFQTQTKNGIVFVIESKRAKFVAPYATARFEAELVFLPGTRFVVKMLCEGNIICLGQPAIAHTFQIKDDDFASKYATSNKSLIVLLEEI